MQKQRIWKGRQGPKGYGVTEDLGSVPSFSLSEMQESNT